MGNEIIKMSFNDMSLIKERLAKSAIYYLANLGINANYDNWVQEMNRVVVPLPIEAFTRGVDIINEGSFNSFFKNIISLSIIRLVYEALNAWEFVDVMYTEHLLGCVYNLGETGKLEVLMEEPNALKGRPLFYAYRV